MSPNKGSSSHTNAVNPFRARPQSAEKRRKRKKRSNAHAGHVSLYLALTSCAISLIPAQSQAERSNRNTEYSCRSHRSRSLFFFSFASLLSKAPKETPLSPLLELEASRLKWGCTFRRAIWNCAYSAAAEETSRLFAYRQSWVHDDLHNYT